MLYCSTFHHPMLRHTAIHYSTPRPDTILNDTYTAICHSSTIRSYQIVVLRNLISYVNKNISVIDARTLCTFPPIFDTMSRNPFYHQLSSKMHYPRTIFLFPFRDIPGASSLSDCFGCPAKFFCPVGSVKYAACPAKYYCPANSMNATICSPGGFCPPDSARPVLCPASYYCPQGISVPTPCYRGVSVRLSFYFIFIFCIMCC